MMKEMNIKNMDGLNIHGYVYTNDDTQKPTVIISHGFTSSMIESSRYKDAVLEAGYHVVLFDFCGGGFQSTSEGSFHDYMTPMTEVNDLKCVYEYVRTLPEVDAQHIYLMGCSQGGFVSTLAAKDLEIEGLLLIYPAFCIPDDARAGQMQTIVFDPNNIPDHIGEMPLRVCGEYARSVLNVDIFEELKKYDGDVLMLHGTDDQIVPYTYAQRANDVYVENGNHITFHTIQNGNHGFSTDQQLNEACEVIRTYLSKRSES